MTADPGIPATESGLPWREYLRPEWLALYTEQALDPERPIIDPHHHIWPWLDYHLDDFLNDIGGGHNVRATVHLETHIGRHTDGPEHLRVVGETKLLLRLIDHPRLHASGAPDVCAGIIGALQIEDPVALVDEALAAHVAAGKGRFKGIRFNTFWYPGISWLPDVRAGMMAEAHIRANLARLPRFGLVCDVMVFHTQLEELAALAATVPDVTFIVNHLGGFLGRVARHEDMAAHRARWLRGIGLLADRPNVLMKLGGATCDFFSGNQFHLAPRPPSSEQIADVMRPFVEPAMERFGAARCMFESNFPADRQQTDYVVLWNAFKRLAAGASDTEQAALFHDTAQRAYSLA